MYGMNFLFLQFDSEFCQLSEDPSPSFLGPFPRGEVSLIAGAPASFKTTLLILMMISAVIGKTLLPGFPVVAPMRVRALFLESRRRVLAKRIRAVCEAHGLDFQTVIEALSKHAEVVLSLDGFNSLDDAISPNNVDAPKAQLILIDTFSRAFDGDNERDDIELTKFVARLEKAAREHDNAGVLLSHHLTKTGSGSGTDRIRGGGGLVAAARFAATLSARKGIIDFQIVKNNDGPMKNYRFQSSVVEMEHNVSSVTLHELDETGEVFQMKKEFSLISQFLQDSKKPLIKRDFDRNSTYLKELAAFLETRIGEHYSARSLRTLVEESVEGGFIQEREVLRGRKRVREFVAPIDTTKIPREAVPGTTKPESKSTMKIVVQIFNSICEYLSDPKNRIVTRTEIEDLGSLPIIQLTKHVSEEIGREISTAKVSEAILLFLDNDKFGCAPVRWRNRDDQQYLSMNNRYEKASSKWHQFVANAC